MRRETEIAWKLWKLLEQHVAVAQHSEEFWTAVAEGKLKGKAEINAKAILLEDHMTPLMRLCREDGFRYSELIDIIPVAFKTTYEERETILADLRLRFDTEYDDIPF